MASVKTILKLTVLW